MSEGEGGFLVRIIGKNKKVRKHYCYAVSFNYDEWKYCLNDDEPKELPPFSKIEILQDEE